MNLCRVGLSLHLIGDAILDSVVRLDQTCWFISPVKTKAILTVISPADNLSGSALLFFLPDDLVGVQGYSSYFNK